MQNAGLGEREGSRIRERPEQQRTRDQRDGGSERAGADPSRRVDYLPAACEGGTELGGKQVEHRARPPGDERRLPVVPDFDQRLAQGRNVDRFPGGDDVIVEVAGARQPDPAVQHLEVAAGRAEAQDVARPEGPRGTGLGCGAGLQHLRIHHLSPA